MCQCCRHANKELNQEVTTVVSKDVDTEGVITVRTGSSHVFVCLFFLMNGVGQKNLVNVH